MKRKVLLGAHVSVAGGLHNAPRNGLKSGCDVIQIFARYPTRWETPEIKEEDAKKFAAAQKKSGIYAVATHASYLINLAASSPSLYKRSIIALADEGRRAALLGIRNVVVHPGSANDTGEEGAVLRVAKAVREALRTFEGAHICIENTAGQGHSIGHKLSHIRDIIDGSGCPERVFVCLDSCHLFAAGYDISTAKGFEDFTRELESFGLSEKVRVIHLNDSRKELGSRVDRHEHIGAGKIGLKGFSNLLNHPPFRAVPFVLETPKGDDPVKSDTENLEKLRKLIRK